jgi:hypothetical protein
MRRLSLVGNFHLCYLSVTEHEYVLGGGGNAKSNSEVVSQKVNRIRTAYDADQCQML